MVTAYRPGSTNLSAKSPGVRGVIRRVLNKFLANHTIPDPKRSTELGSAASASPSTYEQSLVALRYERRAIIQDCRLMVLDDPRARRATQKFAREAVRKGVTITFGRAALEKAGKRNATIARETAARIKRIVDPKAHSWAWMQIVEGDLFVQAVIQDGEVATAKRMPAAGMERLSDDTDEFPDPYRAFSQVDISNDADITYFPLGLMWHGRWSHIDGERYGTPEIVAGRRMRRLLELEEAAQAVRRFTRAPRRTLWNVGDKDKPGTEDDVKKFREENGFVEGKREIFDPANVALDFFGNGRVTSTPVGGDEGVGDIGDILHLQNVYASTSLPTPPALYNLDGDSVNRDVLEDQRAEFLKETATLTDLMKEAVCWLVDLDLLLHGVAPETLPYTVHFSESSLESASEVVDRVIKLRGNEYGSGPTAQPDPLISKRRAMQQIADHVDIQDVDEELEDLDIEMAEREKQTRAKTETDATAQAKLQIKLAKLQPQPAPGAMPGAMPNAGVPPIGGGGMPPAAPTDTTDATATNDRQGNAA